MVGLPFLDFKTRGQGREGTHQKSSAGLRFQTSCYDLTSFCHFILLIMPACAIAPLPGFEASLFLGSIHLSGVLSSCSPLLLGFFPCCFVIKGQGSPEGFFAQPSPHYPIS